MKKIAILVSLNLFFIPISLMLNRAEAINSTPLSEPAHVIDVNAINVPGFGEPVNPCTLDLTLCETAPDINSQVEAFAEGNGNTPSEESEVPCAPNSEVPCPVIINLPDVEVVDEGNGNTPSEESNPTPTGNGGGGGGGGGFSFFQTDVIGSSSPTNPTTPTNSDQQVLGEQVFADGTPSQQVLGEKKFASVLGEKVTSPTFPKTGSASGTTNSILWQLSFTFLFLAFLFVSFNPKKTGVTSK